MPETSEMIYRYLGKSGLVVSALSLGSWGTYGVKSSEDDCYDCMKFAFENGINFFDTAETYGDKHGDAEIVMGNALKRLNWKRAEYVIATKIFWGGKTKNERGLSRKHVLEAIDNCLSRLQLTYVDMVFAHRPDAVTPMEEVVRAFSHLVNTGKVHYWGTSEWSSQQITEAYWIAKVHNLVPPTMEQPQYNMFAREKLEKEYLPLYKEPYGIGTTTWSPLSGGVLTGKYNNGIPEGSRLSLKAYGDMLKGTLQNIPKVIELEKIAKEIGCTVGNLAIAWCVSNKNVSTVILGASGVDQLKENLKCLEVVPKLTPEVLQKIEEILGNKPKQDPLFNRDPRL